MTYYVDPMPMTDAALTSSTLAEDTVAAWVTGTNYTSGAEVYLASTHRVYRDSVGGVSATSPHIDTVRWKDMRPTNKWAPFDQYSGTRAQSTTADITYVFTGRFVNALIFYALAGSGIVVSIKDAPGGTQIYRYPTTGTARLKRPARGYWDYAYGDRVSRRTLQLFNLPIRSNAEITVTISAGAGQLRAVGMIVRGKLRALAGRGWGGVEQGAEADPKTYTTRTTASDGSFKVIVRGSAKDLRWTLHMERKNADAAVQQLEDLMSKPVAVLATMVAGFDGLSAFGFITRSPVRYRNTVASCDLTCEGIV